MLAGETTGQADDIHLEAEQLNCSLGTHFSLKAASSTVAWLGSQCGLRLCKTAQMLNVYVGPFLVKETLLKTKMTSGCTTDAQLQTCCVSAEALVSSAGLSGPVSLGSSVSHRGWHPSGQHMAGEGIFHVFVI